jgi:serine/threonine protein kinase/tetratricopeptide (TPR) repeat protein
MSSDDWQKLELIFQTAMELDTSERSRYVAEACVGNDGLRCEVNSLCQALETNDAFLSESVLDLGLQIINENDRETLIGKTIGHYKIEEKLGEGGMGDVYLAEDTCLGRPVALKFLVNPVLDDNWGKRQMIKEARAAARLEHPNICPIYGVEEIDGHRIIVMQYIAGETLSALIRKGSISDEQILPMARQIIEALAAAHARGIIHCDVKPGNIMIMPNGHVVVLDFGLAKVIHQKTNQGNGEQSCSLASQSGLIQGTVAYMSPEQLKGERLDVRSDIFSFGALLFELCTGIQPFTQKSNAETITAILSSVSPVDTHAGAKMASRLRPLIRKCLERKKEQRYRSASELMIDLDNPRQIRDTHVWVYAPVAAVFLALLLLVSGLVFYFSSAPVYTAAVVPFKNETADPSLDPLADVITEGMISKLSGSERLKVKPFTIVSGYKGAIADFVSLGRDVGSQLILSGKIIRRDGQVLVQANLFDAERGTTLRSWEDNVEPKDILSYENSLSERFLTMLSINSGDLSEKRHRGASTQNNEAFRQYWNGRYYWRMRDEKNIKLAIDAFNKAIELDPSYALPYSGLADSYVLMSLAGYGDEPVSETMSKARVAARQALEIDAQNAEAHTSLGIVLTKYDWNWAEAERELRQAVQIDPEYAAAHYWLSDVLAINGRADESIKEAERAKELDPFTQQSEVNLGRTYYYARQYDQALAVLSNAGRGNRQDYKVKYMIGLVYLQKQMYADALKIFQEVELENHSLAQAALGYTYVRLGMQKEAMIVLEGLKASKDDDHVPYEELAFIYTALGDRDKAFRCLNEAYKIRHPVLIALRVEPMFDPLRDDKRFAELLEKMSLV